MWNSTVLALVSLLCFGAFTVSAQNTNDTASFNTDELFRIGRELVFDGKRNEGRKWLDLALEKSPTYADITIFLARTYAWDGQRKKSIDLLLAVRKREPKNTECILALMDVYFWDDQEQEALLAGEAGLKNAPNNTDLLYKKAKILNSVGKTEESSQVAQQILSINPGHKEARELVKELKGAFKKNSVAFGLSSDRFSRTFDPAYYSYIQYSRLTPIGSVQFRVNGSSRFDTTGYQPEFDFYPTIYKGLYAYVNYGFSTKALFPRHRIGFELYSGLPYSMEASAGFRYMKFRSSTVLIYTATLGWYIGNFWISARTYITPDEKSFSKSLTLQSRYYLGNAQTFVGVRGSLGFSPDVTTIQSGEGFTSTITDIYYLKAFRVGVEYQKTWASSLFISLNLGVSDQELSFSRGEFVRILEGRGSVGINF